jgi:hypothetical protein
VGFVTLPPDCLEVIRISVYATSNVVEAANNMTLRIFGYAGSSSEGYGAEYVNAENVKSVEEGGIVADDRVHWVIDKSDDADIADLAAGDVLQLYAAGEVADAPDIATDCLMQTFLIEYLPGTEKT